MGQQNNTSRQKASSEAKEVYFHIGTGKTGSKFLQYRVFPKFSGIHYIQRTRYKSAIRIVQKSQDSKFLISNEFDQQLERETRQFASVFPQTRIIIVFRRQDSYIASQYRRFVKNGFTGSFREFFDLENDTGRFKKKDLSYCDQIDGLTRRFTHPPCVLIYDELRDDPKKFIHKLADYMHISVDVETIRFGFKHKSYSEKQLKVFRKLNRFLHLKQRDVFRNEKLHFVWRVLFGAIHYTILHSIRLIPDALISKAPLIPPEDLQDVQEYFREDWECCKTYANKQCAGHQSSSA